MAQRWHDWETIQRATSVLPNLIKLHRNWFIYRSSATSGIPDINGRGKLHTPGACDIGDSYTLYYEQ